MNRTLNSLSETALSGTSGAARGASLQRRKTASGGTAAFGLLVAIALGLGWFNRTSLPTAESGIGYYLGITGALGMLALLAYPMRKHAPFMRGAGPVAWWFRAHMALGLIGPTLIVYHAKFSTGSLNSNVALFSMLIVAGSGIIGRYFYAKIHKGLYGAKADLKLLGAEAKEFRAAIGDDVDSALSKRFDAVERAAFSNSQGMAVAAVKAFSVTSSARSLHHELKRRLKVSLRKASAGVPRRKIREHMNLCDRYFKRVEQAAELELYERLFSAWHLLHLPLFLLLIVTAVIHVVAVHLY